MLSLDTLARVRPWQWGGLALVILAVDYLTGPFVQFPILFILPVGLAALASGRRTGVALAVALPFLRLSFDLVWGVRQSWTLAIIDSTVDCLVLVGFAVLVTYIAQQQRELKVLQGMLPICCFCKQIRTTECTWQQVDQFVAEHSEAEFTHTFCPDCYQVHYGKYLGKEDPT